MKKQMNIEDLRNSLLDSFQELKNGTLGLKEARTQSEVAGQIIISAKVELAHRVFLEDKTPIEFLKTNKKLPTRVTKKD